MLDFAINLQVDLVDGHRHARDFERLVDLELLDALATGLLVLGATLPVVRAQVAILADPVGVVGPLRVKTLIGKLLATARVVAVLAHPFSIEGLRCVGALGDVLGLFVLLNFLVGLFALAHASPTPAGQLSTQALGGTCLGLLPLVFRFLLHLNALHAFTGVAVLDNSRLHVLELVVHLFGVRVI